jgi:hypothetical protein
MDGVKITEEVIYQGPEEKTQPPTKGKVQEIIMETENYGKKFIH